MCSSECILLGDTSNRKRLTRKTRDEHIMMRNCGSDGFIGARDFPDVAGNWVIRPKVRAICLRTKSVVLGRKDALTTSLLKPQARTSDAGKEIDERKVRTARRVDALWLCSKEVV